ncbi:MAG: RsmB/NOP family class I SAM-dependent RNA methyltransferase [Lachnospiraceae bacterium]|nr:RsmB/NOP family class I SAM-dependent RNA methyltransferase [Lachnospiraceae bacterium]
MNLPEAFLERMKEQLGTEYDAFVSSYESDVCYGLRINLLKGTADEIIPVLPFSLRNIPWAPEGFYADSLEHPGRHPLHEAGAYYIQEPSAMSVVSLLDPAPGETICDLCAAPGGKSTQIAGRIQDDGLLVANEIIPNRAKILSQNIERMGISNVLVCNETPDRMATLFPMFFDKVLVDAPCSGEGMFRKDKTAVTEWSPTQVEICRERQETILKQADTLLKPGGVLVYSTCTFSPVENEDQIRHFLETHKEYSIEPWQDFLPVSCGITNGSLSGTMRLFPHKLEGEGHFAVRLRKAGTSQIVSHKHKEKGNTKNRKKAPEDMSIFWDFINDNLTNLSIASTDYFEFFGDELYRLPSRIPTVKGIKLERPGLHLGTRKKNRFEPALAFAKTLNPDNVQHIECSEEDALRYLHGETLSAHETMHGWTLICHKGFPLGWAKATQGMLKNHYPKGLRIQY